MIGRGLVKGKAWIGGEFMGEWDVFFAAELGTAGALAGLIMVAISINVSRILAIPYLPGRAAETLVTPTGVLVVSSYALVPHQPAWLFASEILFTGFLMWLVPSVIQFRAVRSGLHKDYATRVIVARVALTQFSSLPFIATGILLYQGVPGALYWMVPGVIVSLVATVLNAWVMLVEILR